MDGRGRKKEASVAGGWIKYGKEMGGVDLDCWFWIVG
jgi:hypothetical protein